MIYVKSYVLSSLSVPWEYFFQETLRVKDEELQNLARDLRARDSTIREIADKLTETAEAAEGAASAAHTMDEQRRIAFAEIERIKQDSAKQLDLSISKVSVMSHFYIASLL